MKNLFEKLSKDFEMSYGVTLESCVEAQDSRFHTFREEKNHEVRMLCVLSCATFRDYANLNTMKIENASLKTELIALTEAEHHRVLDRYAEVKEEAKLIQSLAT